MKIFKIIGVMLILSIVSIISSISAYPQKLPRCDMYIAESMPEDLTYDSTFYRTPTIASVWMDIIKNYRKSLRVTSFYWTLLNSDVSKKTFPSSYLGKRVFEMLLNKSKDYPLEIITNTISKGRGADLAMLQKMSKKVKVHVLDFDKLIGRGVQHAKVWVADNTTAFVGSPNMDWRSLIQIKELGVYIPNCAQIAYDIDRYSASLKYISEAGKIPDSLPLYLSPKYTLENPFMASVNNVTSSVFVATSPKSMNPRGRTDDLTALLYTINTAHKLICVSVMNLEPIVDGYHKFNNTYWSNITDALVRAAHDRGVRVRLLISKWKQTNPNMIVFLQSLDILRRAHVDIQVKLFIVPAFTENQRQIPFSRVSHSKYMVTDSTVYVGTSNWSGDYFLYTGGVSVVVKDQLGDFANQNRGSYWDSTTQPLRYQLQHVFDSDWYSIYAHNI